MEYKQDVVNRFIKLSAKHMSSISENKLMCYRFGGGRLTQEDPEDEVMFPPILHCKKYCASTSMPVAELMRVSNVFEIGRIKDTPVYFSERYGIYCFQLDKHPLSLEIWLSGVREPGDWRFSWES